MKILSKARSVGGSLVVTIPKEIVETQELHEGDLVELEVQKSRKSFFGIARGIASFTSDDELVAHE
ncbi:AbrB/MazE/SpoVT family DNA-binding domain-containing protein [Candidatus Micrarchaeota archaeon]|nr:AbrB/MazE/SpoVT family DNA-binding domain-containing protein [Candidatus Micrarchaeota archaeon]